VQVQKISILPPQKGLEFSGGWGFCKTKKFNKMCEALLEFPQGWGILEKKSLSWGRYGYFLELHNTWKMCLFSFFTGGDKWKKVKYPMKKWKETILFYLKSKFYFSQ